LDAALAVHCPEVVAVLKTLIIGEHAGISADLREAFNRVGVGHVLAISGLHIGMVVAENSSGPKSCWNLKRSRNSIISYGLTTASYGWLISL
jgi:predicted membrane metal-binding protein